jgi:hypothetical protein
VNGTFSEAFLITNGMRQGCIADPILFNLFYAAMLDAVLGRITFKVISDQNQNHTSKNDF